MTQEFQVRVFARPVLKSGERVLPLGIEAEKFDPGNVPEIVRDTAIGLEELVGNRLRVSRGENFSLSGIPALPAAISPVCVTAGWWFGANAAEHSLIMPDSDIGRAIVVGDPNYVRSRHTKQAAVGAGVSLPDGENPLLDRAVKLAVKAHGVETDLILLVPTQHYLLDFAVGWCFGYLQRKRSVALKVAERKFLNVGHPGGLYIGTYVEEARLPIPA